MNTARKWLHVKITIDHPDLLLETLTQRFPAHDLSLRCYGWDHHRGVYLILDPKTGKRHRLETKDLSRGLSRLLDEMGNGYLPALAETLLPDIADIYNWDVWAIDALIQCAVFGEVRYG